ncbi:hypothetical protein Tco_0690677 [Tanacetum coccineum]
MASTTEHKAVEDEDTGAHIAPIVKLDEVAVTTGDEDDDDPLFIQRRNFIDLIKMEPVEATRENKSRLTSIMGLLELVENRIVSSISSFCILDTSL